MSLLADVLSRVSILALALFAPALFRFADRRVGSDEPLPKSTGYGPVALYLAAFAGLAWFKVSPIAAALAALVAAWLLYRSLGWKTGGSMTPRTFSQIFGAYVRHNVPTLAYLGLDRGADYFPWIAPLPAAGVLPFVAFGIYATDLAVQYGRLSSSPFISEGVLRGRNALNEKSRGLAFGLAFAACSALILIGQVLSP